MKQVPFLILLIILLVSCQQTSQKLRLAEEIIETQPDSALKILRKIDYKNQKSKGDKALYGILMFKALDKNYLTLAPDSLINFSIEFYQNENDYEKLGEALFFKGRMLNYAFKYENATKYYIESLDKLSDSRNYNLLAKVHSDIGDILTIQGDYVQALNKYQKSHDFFLKIHKDKEALYKKIDIGNTFRNQDKFLEAHENYKYVLTQSTDSLLTGHTIQEIGVTYFRQNKFDSTVYYLNESIKYPFVDFDMSIRLYRLSDAYYELRQLDSALIYAKKSLTFPANFYTRRECYRILANTCYLQKEFKTMAGYMTHYQTMTDSIRKIDMQTKATIIENIHQSNTSIKKKSGQVYWLISLIALILTLGIFISYWFIKRNRKISEQKKAVEASLNASINEKEQNKFMLRESLKELIEKNKALRSNGKKNADVLLSDETIFEIYSQALQINDYALFSQKINAAYNNMVCELAIKFPAINQKEMFYCCFVLLDIPQNHAMVLLETTSNGLYKIRQRLAQKLELSSTRELDDFLKNTYGQ